MANLLIGLGSVTGRALHWKNAGKVNWMPLSSIGMKDRTPTKLIAIEQITHDTKRFVVARPDGFDFEPGQATEISIDRHGWRDEGRPFTFTSLPSDANLEFTIKRYPDHDGVTDRLHELKAGDTLLLKDVFGAISYKGPGVFLAGGAGVTPFIAVLRQVERDAQLQDNTLIFANKTEQDIIDHAMWCRMLGNRAIFTLSQEKKDGFEHGRIDRALIEKHVQNIADTRFYLCGPPPMMQDLGTLLKEMGAEMDSVVLDEG